VVPTFLFLLWRSADVGKLRPKALLSGKEESKVAELAGEKP